MNKVFSTVVGSSLLAIGAMTFAATDANAASMTCSVSDVTATGYGNADSCAGYFDGNDDGAQGTLDGMLDNNLFGNFGDWSQVGKSDQGGSGVTANNNQTSGVWSVLEALTGPFVVSVKAGNSYSAYFFENTDSLDIFGGTFSTAGVKPVGRGNTPGLSHLSVWTPEGGNQGGDPTDVPEPASILGLGILAGAATTLKRKKQG